MDSKDVRDLVVSSSEAVYDYITCMQYAVDPPMGVSIADVSSYDIKGNYAILHLESPLYEQSSPMLMVDSEVFTDSAVCFQRYDEISRTIMIRPSPDVMILLERKDRRLRVLSDMRFLITAIREFFDRYGEMVSIPDMPGPTCIPIYPDGMEPTMEQRHAVDVALGNRLSYIWGAPGTGKTQMVLATCIRTLVASGRRVGVFAPTNNSVEQVLNGLIDAMDGDLPPIIRLGIPSKRFLSEHPTMCEDRYAQNRLRSCRNEISNLEEVLMERSADILYENIGDLERGSSHADCVDPSSRMEMLRPYAHLLSREQLEEVMAMGNVLDICSRLRRFLESRDRPVKGISEYTEWSDADIISEIVERRKEESTLRVHDASDIMDKVSIVAGTPLQFISRFRPRGSEDDGRPELDVDHIFLDEAGYSNLPQALSLLTNGVPVTMLGDHMQLPPVCELDDDVMHDGARRGNRMRDSFIWDLSALHIGTVLS